jgi:hypothetical protein
MSGSADFFQLPLFSEKLSYTESERIAGGRRYGSILQAQGCFRIARDTFPIRLQIN